MENKPNVEKCRYWQSNDCNLHKRPCYEVCKAYESKFFLKRMFGLTIFLTGLALVLTMYLPSVYLSSSYLIAFVSGLLMLAMGGSIIIYYEGKGRSATNEEKP